VVVVVDVDVDVDCDALKCAKNNRMRWKTFYLSQHPKDYRMLLLHMYKK
jgi:hypothetical protein